VTIAKRNHNLAIGPCAFERGRVLGEKRARKRAGRLEVTIKDIYGECRSILKLSKKDVEVLISCEIKLEIELCRPIRAGLALLENARREGSRVVFIFDMYLPGSAASRHSGSQWMLEGRGPPVCFLRSGRNKAEWRAVPTRAEIGIRSSQPEVHAGNHPHSDVGVPGRFGIGIEPFFQSNLNARESQLATTKDFDALLPSLLAGCSRLVRLGGTGTTAQHQRLRELAAHTAGPFLCGFVLWVLQTAKAIGFKRLYFISRDGLILLKVAKELAPFCKNSKIEVFQVLSCDLG